MGTIGEPLTKENLEMIEEFCKELRQRITQEALKVSGAQRDVVDKHLTSKDLGITGNLSKAFDALQQASMFVNVAWSHVDYARQHYERHTNRIGDGTQSGEVVENSM